MRSTVSVGEGIAPPESRDPLVAECRERGERLGDSGKVVGLEASPKTVFVAECRVGWGRFG